MVNLNFKKLVRSIILILGIIFVISLFINKSTYSHKEMEYTTIQVTKGDTLWKIASNLQQTNKVYENKDIRYIIENIKEINELTNSSLYVNQELIIPVG